MKTGAMVAMAAGFLLAAAIAVGGPGLQGGGLTGNPNAGGSLADGGTIGGCLITGQTINCLAGNLGIADAGTARVGTALVGSLDAGNALITGALAVTGAGGVTIGNVSNATSITGFSASAKEILATGAAGNFVGSIQLKGMATAGGAETNFVFGSQAAMNANQALTQWRNGSSFSSTKVREVMSNGLMWVINADAGVPGNITINQPSGTVAIANGATGMTLTNSTVAAATRVHVQLMTNDATCAGVNAFPAAGSVAINCNAGTSCGTAAGCNVFFEVIDQR